MLEVTNAAVVKFKDLMQKEGKPGFGLRLNVLPGGCSGFTYDLSFEQRPTKEDMVMEKDGLKIFIDKDVMEFLQGVKIDFVDSLQGSGFKIDNPNAQHSCGCGKSFG
ncbi:iron-sulfur cluster assembly accessory protein [Candidatus Woesearchaeota archaeon]|nr:iron-sulfur cluster assembly accessory protein [Candidatus Woesearchaeota archaeon]